MPARDVLLEEHAKAGADEQALRARQTLPILHTFSVTPFQPQGLPKVGLKPLFWKSFKCRDTFPFAAYEILCME